MKEQLIPLGNNLFTTAEDIYHLRSKTMIKDTCNCGSKLTLRMECDYEEISLYELWLDKHACCRRPCKINPYNINSCSRGVKGCTVKHNDPIDD